MIRYIVWALRVIVGATFIFSGFVKAVDPWGFIYKIDEYLQAWGIDYLSRGIELCAAGVLATFEFVSGVLLITGCLRRLTSWVLAAMMAVMLPLTAYIAIASPVADCGCFGDAWVLSNTMTFVKNIVLTAMIAYLFVYNKQVGGLYEVSTQWVVLGSSMIYCFILIVVGYLVQPMVDFRPYGLGKPLLSGGEHDATLIYEKDGVEQEFSAYALPDSSWTYVGRTEIKADDDDSRLLAVFDGEEDVSDWVVSDQGEQLILLVSDPQAHSRARASMANRLNEYMQEHGGEMVCFIPLSGNALEQWRQMAHPTYDVYTVEDTTIKEMARGDAALIFLKDGLVQWKRNLYSLRGDFPDFNSAGNEMDRVIAVDDGRDIGSLTLVYICILLLPLLIRCVKLFRHRH